MVKLYIVGFGGKTKVYGFVIENNQSVKDNLSYGGEATFNMWGDHGAVFDTNFYNVLIWNGQGKQATPYGKRIYGLK